MTDDLTPKEPQTTPGLVPDPDPAPAPADDPAPAPADEPEQADEPKASRFDKRMIGLGIATGAVAVVIVLLALMVFAPGVAPIKVGSVAQAQRAAEERAVDRVAARFASALYTFNYRTIDADIEAIGADATGNFSRQLAEVLGEVDVFKEAIVEARGESVGQVQGVDVRSVEGDTASARVFVLQAIRNRKNPEPRQQLSTVELTLVRTATGWKVDDVQQLSAGTPGTLSGQ